MFAVERRCRERSGLDRTAMVGVYRGGGIGGVVGSYVCDVMERRDGVVGLWRLEMVVLGR